MNFKVTAVQMACTKCESRNLQRAVALIFRAARKGAKIICLPELANTGYFLPAIKRRAASHHLAARAIGKAARECRAYVVIGLAEKAGEALYNSAFVFSPEGKMVGKYRKNHLFPGKPMKESECFKPGKRAMPIVTPLCAMGLMICFDIRFPGMGKGLAEKGAEVFFVPAAWPGKRITHWKALTVARAIENRAYVVASNRCGRDGGMNMGGASAIISPDGNKLCGLGSKKEGIAMAEIRLRSPCSRSSQSANKP